MSLYKGSLYETYLRKASLYRTQLVAVILVMSLMAAGYRGTASPNNPGGAVTRVPGTMGSARESEGNRESMETGESMGTGKAKEDRGVDYESEPVCGDGLKDDVYPTAVGSDSNMFCITEYELTAKDGFTSTIMAMEGMGYPKLYMDAGEEAQKTSDQDFAPYVEAKDGVHASTVPVVASD